MRQTFIAWPAQHSFRLRCKARGQPPLMYQWLKNGDPKFRRRLQPSLRTNSWSMKLKDLIADDSGKYTCIVSNKYGSINHTYTLKVVGESHSRTNRQTVPRIAYFRAVLKARLHMRFLMRFMVRFRVQNAPHPTLHECFFSRSVGWIGKKVITYYCIWRHPAFQFLRTWRFVAALRD